MYRPTYLKIDLNKLKNNITAIKKKYPDYKYYFGVVKGNAYGHGYGILKTLVEAGINYFAVSSLDEAMEIRKKDEKTPILVLEPINLMFCPIVIKNNITITLADYDDYLALKDYKDVSKLKIHLKIDTGMNRLGINDKEQIEEIVHNKKIKIEGIYTHYSTSGKLDKNWDRQLEQFKYLTSDIDLNKIKIVHLGRSITLTNHKKQDFENGIRLGIIMYGIDGRTNYGSGIRGKLRNCKNNLTRKINHISKTSNDKVDVQPVVTLFSEIIQVRKCKKGSYLGYGTDYKFINDTYIAIVPFGYFDGASMFDYVYINGKEYRVVGEPCMDMMMIEVDSTVKKGDIVNFIDEENKEITLKEVCDYSGLSAYKVLTGISDRVDRIYIEYQNH